MDIDTHLGDYLRARRELVRPGDAGLPNMGHRRVPGLRREEVALLAGISVEYYERLETGRGRHPSGQVLDSIARALQLDDEAAAYLHALAAPATRRRAVRHPERVSPGVQQLINGWDTTPAYVHGRYLDVLAANRLAVALSPFNAPGTNVLLAAFLEPEMREFHQDWEQMTARVVPYLRAVAGPDAGDPRLIKLVGELSVRSDRFRTLWARHDVRHKASGSSRLLHPQVGPLELHYQKLALPGTQGQMLVTYRAEPGTASHERLLLLASLTGEDHLFEPFGASVIIEGVESASDPTSALA